MKIKGVFVFLLILLSVVGLSRVTNAALVDNGGGLIYDTDLKITWYDSPYYDNGYYPNIAQWAADLNVGGATNWRLPRTGDFTLNSPSNAGELGHLFVDELKNTTAFTNKGPFTHFATGDYLNAFYTETTLDGYQYFYYHFDTGAQYLANINYSYFWIHGLAVHDGNVGGSPVPIPAAVWLFGTGLLGLFGVRRKIRK